jgi:hypothetical protein
MRIFTVAKPNEITEPEIVSTPNIFSDGYFPVGRLEWQRLFALFHSSIAVAVAALLGVPTPVFFQIWHPAATESPRLSVLNESFRRSVNSFCRK